VRLVIVPDDQPEPLHLDQYLRVIAQRLKAGEKVMLSRTISIKWGNRAHLMHSELGGLCVRWPGTSYDSPARILKVDTIAFTIAPVVQAVATGFNFAGQLYDGSNLSSY